MVPVIKNVLFGIQPHLICKMLEPYFSFPLESDHLWYHGSSSHTRTLNPLPQPYASGIAAIASISIKKLPGNFPTSTAVRAGFGDGSIEP
jgi:hypothetical protein